MTIEKRRALVAFISGLVFALGLGIAGMTSPKKVLDFLDIFGNWDPSLALVMGGAIVVYAPIYHRIKGKDAPRLSEQFHWPTKKDVDARLVTGSIMFGVGWGLVGACPGPAVVMTVEASVPTVLFTGSMLLGMVLKTRVAHRLDAWRADTC